MRVCAFFNSYNPLIISFFLSLTQTMSLFFSIFITVFFYTHICFLLSRIFFLLFFFLSFFIFLTLSIFLSLSVRFCKCCLLIIFFLNFFGPFLFFLLQRHFPFICV